MSSVNKATIGSLSKNSHISERYRADRAGRRESYRLGFPQPTLLTTSEIGTQGYFDSETLLSLRRRAESSFCAGLSSEEKICEMLFSNSGIAFLYSLTPLSVSTT